MMDDDAPPRPGSNGFDPDQIKGLVGRIETLHGDLLTERSEYTTRCKGIREDMRLVFNDAEKHGVPRKALKAVINARALEKRAEAAREDLEPDVQDTFDNIRHALGDLADLPLGAAALDEVSAQRARKNATPVSPGSAPLCRCVRTLSSGLPCRVTSCRGRALADTGTSALLQGRNEISWRPCARWRPMQWADGR